MTNHPPVAELLGPNGPLAGALPGYEERPGQTAMASLVEKALRQERVVLCEAGTGTGKTLAYLLPALLSGRKVVVSTATRALQDQIFFKDLPLVVRAFGIAPRVALLKGIGNYLCRRRYSEFRTGAESQRPVHAKSLAAIEAWQAESETGDLSELAALPENDPVRLEVAASSDTRVGSSCPHYEECFVTRAKREAESAQLVVVNHHLFFADLALRGPHPARVLPDYDAVVFDEAHQLEDVATQFFSVRVSNQRVERLFLDIERTLRAAGLADPLFASDDAQLVERARAGASGFFTELTRRVRGEGRLALERDVWTGNLARAYHGLDDALEAASALLERSQGRLSQRGKPPPQGLFEALLVAERRVGTLREQLATIVDAKADRVVWLETQARRVVVSSSPVDLSILLRERVFESVPTVILTSATLATSASLPRDDTPARTRAGRTREPAAGRRFVDDIGATEGHLVDDTDAREPATEPPGVPKKGPFSFVRARLGLGDEHPVEELVVSSPFDFAQKALLYTPRDLPPPGTLEFWDAAATRVLELIAITGGGCFVLTTSLRAMQELHARVKSEHPRRVVLLQGEAPKSSLIARFRGAGDAVLFATLGFWEGVDVPGRALRLVVLEKIPFAVPTDPIVSARARVLEEQGRNPFIDLHVPAAALTLKQGFGRLVRSARDAGIVALLDERIHRKAYGRKLLAALPPARRTHELEEVRRFFESLPPTE